MSLDVTTAMIGRNGELVALPADTRGVIRDYFSASKTRTRELENAICNLRELDGNTLRPRDIDRLLLPELFIDRQRIAYYDELAEDMRRRTYAIFYDLITLTHPQYCGAWSPVAFWAYFRLMRKFHHLSFISRHSRSVYYRRFLLKTERADPILHLGSDSLGPKPPHSRHISNGTKEFLMLGNLEPRKNAPIVLDAFEALVQSRKDVCLTFAGANALDGEFFARLRRIEAETGQLRWIENPEDSVVRGLFEQARASIFISSAEGFGLPAVESLWFGVPVIAARDIPSLEYVQDQGVCYVERTPSGVAEAMKDLLDDELYRQKSAEAKSLELPTWAGMAAEVESWLLNA